MSKERINRYTVLVIVLLLFGGIIHALEHRVDNEHFSSICFTFLMILYIGLVIFWIRSVYERLLPSYTRQYLIVEALFMILLFIFRNIKYRLAHSYLSMRLLWYLYYLPFIMIPTFFLIAAMSFGNNYIDGQSKRGVTGRVRLSIIIFSFAMLLVLGIVTNDINHLAFIPKVPLEDFYGKTGDYTYGPLFYAAYIWIGSSITIAAIYLVVITRRRSNWIKGMLTLLPILLYPLMDTLKNLMEAHGFEALYEVPEIFVFSFVMIQEICVRNRLIAYNEDYSDIFKRFNTPAVIVSNDGQLIYTTGEAFDVTGEDMEHALDAPVRLNENSRLFGMQIRGGYVYWIADESELNRVNASLEEANETLSLENKLIQYENEQKEERTRIDVRNSIYRKAATTVYPQQKRIETLLDELEKKTNDTDTRELVAKASLLNAFVKRKSNFVLTYSEDETISSREIYLAMDEMIRYMGYLGILGSVENVSRGGFKYSDALSMYDTFLLLVDNVIGDTTKLLVVISDYGFKVLMDCKEDLHLESPGWNISTVRDGEQYYLAASLKRGGAAR